MLLRRLDIISWVLSLQLRNGTAAFKSGLHTTSSTFFTTRSAASRLEERRASSSIELNTTKKNMSSNNIDREFQLFGRFKIATSQIFYRSKHSFAMVNLRPLVSGHVLVVSNRVVPLLSDLESEEYDDIWRTVRSVQSALKQQYKCDAFNVAVQDGVGAGQSVPHVHVHILPRFCGDLERNDDIYDQLESWAPRTEMQVNKPKIDVPEDSERRDRTIQEMTEEALLYKSLLE